MAPPTWLALASTTGATRFRTFAEEEFAATDDELWRDVSAAVGTSAGTAGLYLRDSTFADVLDAAGNETFWGRGNGWVFAALPAILRALPPASPLYELCAVRLSERRFHRLLLIASSSSWR